MIQSCNKLKFLRKQQSEVTVGIQAPAQAQPVKSTPAKPSGSQTHTQAPAQTQPQAPAQAQLPRPAQAYLPHDEDRLSMDFPESKVSLIETQAHSELLDWIAIFCSLKRSDTEDQRRVKGMKNPVYHGPTRAAIHLALPWYRLAVEIADRKFNIVMGKLSKCMKSLNPAKRWGPKDFFLGVGYHTHNLKGYVPKPESIVIPLRSPPAE